MILSLSAFWVLFVLIFENEPENTSYKRADKKDLAEKRHGKIQHKSLEPYGNNLYAGLFEQQGCNQAHGRAHQAHNHGGKRKHKPLWIFFLRIGKLQRKFVRKFIYNKQFKKKRDRPHNEHFMKRGKENAVFHFAGIQRNIVTDHGIDHNERHKQRENYGLKFCFRHWFTPFIQG